LAVDDGRVDRYDVLLVQKNETARVYASYAQRTPKT
jgi:hypothetical protein